MGAVALPLPQRATWGELLAVGVRLTVDAITVKVSLTGPKGPATTARGEIAWRSEAMRERWALGFRSTLLAVPGLRVVDRVFCLSCGDRLPKGDAGDCVLCVAARVLVLRDAGVLAPPPPYTPPPVERVVRTEPGVLLSHTDPKPWVCVRCKRTVTGLYADPDGECGPCELERIAVSDMSRLGGEP